MLGVIGGTGLYQIDGLDDILEVEVETPFGQPSSEIVTGKCNGNNVAFLPRHGKNHSILPSEINYRANIWALKSVGVRKIISVSATGSLREEIKPGDLVIPSQYLDWTRGVRSGTFFGNGIAAHISTAKPACEVLTNDIVEIGKKHKIHIHTGKTYACVEGPRLGTQAESFFLRNAGGDIVGMTNLPEAFLAREAQLSYCSIAIVTDFDCWKNEPNDHANVSDIIEEYGKNLKKIKTLIMELFKSTLSESPPYCRKSLDGAVLSNESFLNDKQKEILSFLRK